MEQQSSPTPRCHQSSEEESVKALCPPGQLVAVHERKRAAAVLRAEQTAAARGQMSHSPTELPVVLSAAAHSSRVSCSLRREKSRKAL